ncbi:hypothetical protein KIN20_005344 [Parelaphostrongylus tenuis]|uniref:Cytochrome b561 domain-containing protein n=1 Tax=Parelaphostrongylus tenuis TaxID=148309 RepID=A0AAD5M338_PARTN|nr:hypothetical protein KIN20_005344 [Parelaphostrongylus tenuis]
MSEKFVLLGKPYRGYVYFDLLLSFNQLFGFAFIILSGYLFETMDIGIKWPSGGNIGGINFHGMFMSTGLVFFQGEALLSHRLYRYDNKFLSRIIHVIFHLLTMAFFSTALAAMILHKNANSMTNFATAHSWIGLSVMCFYIIQFLFGLASFVLRGIAKGTRQNISTIHKIIGSVIFTASIVQSAIGFTQYNATFKTSCEKYGSIDDTPLTCNDYKFVYNFTIITGIFYGITILGRAVFTNCAGPSTYPIRFFLRLSFMVVAECEYGGWRDFDIVICKISAAESTAD